MLNYFFNQSLLKDVSKIKELLNIKKTKLQLLDFDEPFKEYQDAEIHFTKIKQIAVELQDEQLANATFITRLYFHLFCNLASYFSLLQNKKYKSSWDTLQDCLDDIYGIGKFVDFDKRFELPFLNKLLKEYEKLYPYKIFASSEYVITKSECSLCGRPMNSLLCPHIKGNLYWGEMAYENILEIKDINAVALVTNPVNKRCIIELADDTRSEVEKFAILDGVLDLNINRFQLFEIKNHIKLIRNKNIIKQGANDLCLCGSGKKFKKCCKQKMYLNHHCFKIYPKEKCDFKYFEIEKHQVRAIDI